MNSIELANKLEGRMFPLEPDDTDWDLIKRNRLCVIHPFIDDQVTVDGAITDFKSQTGDFSGSNVRIDRNGFIQEGLNAHPYRIARSITFRAVRRGRDGGPQWTYHMPENFPHSTFRLMDSADVMATCVVFSINDLPRVR